MNLRQRLRYARLYAFLKVLRPFSLRARERRMQRFVETLAVAPYDRVLDLGGRADTWALVHIPLNITILNLEGQLDSVQVPPHNVDYIKGNACNLKGIEPGDYDIVFSNSVIEHVGPESSQEMFANEVARLKTKYWIQTPSKWFPIEAHCGMPFWWFYPRIWRENIMRRWRKKLPDWTRMVEETRVLERNRLATLFPHSTIYTEHFLGISKSYTAWGIPRATKKTD